VVLYEMLGGRRPFAAPTGFALSDAILNSSPKPLPAGVPAAARTVIERCLAKAPSERFQSAVEVRAALETVLSGRAIPASMHRTSRLPRYRWWLAAAAAAAIVAVLGVLDAGGLRRWLPGGGGRPRVVRMAVLPFVNLTGDPEQEYLSDGFTQEMISQLGRLHPDGLSVIARASVMRYKAGDTPIDQIGRELNVDYVLEGSARREANLVRISAELIHVRDQTQIWADTFERELAGILAVQSEVAQRVAQALALTLLPAEGARLAATRTVDPEAYEAYLKGTHHWQKATPADLDTAERYFELALEEDPSYAPAYEGLAWVWAVRQQFGIAPPHEAGPKAKTAALQAVALDEASAEAHEALALVRTWTDWDWAGAEPEWRRALEINPNGANAHAYYAHFLAIIGRTGEALHHSERALELDRFNGLFHGLYSLVLCFDQRFDEAVAAARAGLALQPHQPVALWALWLSAANAGLHKEAVAAGEVYLKVLYGDSALGQALDRGRAAGGYSEAMLRAATALAARYETSGAVSVDIAGFYVEAGEHGRALDWLEQAYRDRDPSLPYLGLPVFDPLRSDPRFKDLMRRMNLPTD
jgi:TolB-like protein/tetratricopeptide (TPR) repeat protein